MSARPATTFRVVVVVPQHRSFGQRALDGIAAFAASEPDWRCLWDPRPTVAHQVEQWLELADGVIFWGQQPTTRPIPMVSIGHDRTGNYAVQPDDAGLGRLAAEHFLDRGFTTLAYLGYANRPFSEGRLAGFRDAAMAAGHRVIVPDTNLLFQRSKRLDDHGPDLAHWLHALPKPVGLFVVSCLEAREVCATCRREGIDVPSDIAVLGVDLDELTCRLCSPPLSTIDDNARLVGYEAAALLKRLAAGERPAERVKRVAPGIVVSRQSTNVLAIADAEVREAIQFIRDNAASQISVADVLKVVPVARRSLEMRFKRSFGRGIYGEILHQRVRKARDLLIRTNLDGAAIARQCGFSSAAKMSSMFSKLTHQTPTQYRKEHAEHSRSKYPSEESQPRL